MRLSRVPLFAVLLWRFKYASAFGNVKLAVDESPCEESVDRKVSCDVQTTVSCFLVGVSSFSLSIESVEKVSLFAVWLISALWLSKVVKMAAHENLQAVGTIILVWAALFFGIPSLTEIPATYHVLVEIITSAGALIVGILYFGLKKPDKTSSIKVEVLREKPVLDLQPLPHYRGHNLPISMEKRRIAKAMADKFPPRGVIKSAATEHTHPEARLLKDSQWITLHSFDPDTLEVNREFIVKFGVIQVRANAGDVRNCRAEVRFRTLEEAGKVINDDWRQAGYLNWFSPDLKQAIGSRMSEMESGGRFLGINKYLMKSVETITEGNTKDLLVFYMIKDVPNVFLCSSLESAPLGLAEHSSVKFEIELTITGEGYATTIWNFRGSAVWDDFSIVKA